MSYLGFTGQQAKADWAVFSEPFGLTYVDRSRDKLDCKTSKNALPLAVKAS
jgi:hypothetical protein